MQNISFNFIRNCCFSRANFTDFRSTVTMLQFVVALTIAYLAHLVTRLLGVAEKSVNQQYPREKYKCC